MMFTTRKFRFSIDWLLIFVPLAVVLHFAAPDLQTFTFIASCLAVIPLAGWMGQATEHLAEKTGEAVGGLLNATFGNAAELIIALAALSRGLHDVVKASLTGSIIGNILLVLGGAMIAGGMKHKVQKFNAQGARSQASMLTLAAIALVLPAAYHYSEGRRSFFTRRVSASRLPSSFSSPTPSAFISRSGRTSTFSPRLKRNTATAASRKANRGA